MVKVAVAGGTGGLGLHIVEGIVETGKHDVVVLSRKPTHPVLEKLGVTIVPVSYDDPASLEGALTGVHTVISTIAALTKDELTRPQLALLDAAVKAGVKRFAPSEFNLRSSPDNPNEGFQWKWVVTEAVQRSGLEYTVFEVGIFTNYLAVGTPGIGHLYPLLPLLDVEHCKGTLPADTSISIVLTTVEDVGKFVAASLDLEKWPEYSQIRGDRKTLAEIVKIVEEVRGRKFDITYLTKERLVELVEQPIEQSAELAEIYGELNFHKIIAKWWLEELKSNPCGYEGKNLNELCPQVHPVGVEEFLRKWWAD